MDYICEKLKKHQSPEQIVGRLELDKKIKTSTATAYLPVLQDRQVGSEPYKYLVISTKDTANAMATMIVEEGYPIV
ncbi:MAG: hypothetical protein A6F72_02000 [Cycloclasticus sp. symbiont of Poecilosclerida sp. N]|nr:MAG: hypothetical protein A6F72_02000 [Cycloclasticus sp. symbiont of Poecilosclerida sp. N]